MADLKSKVDAPQHDYPVKDWKSKCDRILDTWTELIRLTRQPIVEITKRW